MGRENRLGLFRFVVASVQKRDVMWGGVVGHNPLPKLAELTDQRIILYKIGVGVYVNRIMGCVDRDWDRSIIRVGGLRLKGGSGYQTHIY